MISKAKWLRETQILRGSKAGRRLGRDVRRRDRRRARQQKARGRQN